jgi:hypothetical protein
MGSAAEEVAAAVIQPVVNTEGSCPRQGDQPGTDNQVANSPAVLHGWRLVAWSAAHPSY